MRRNHAYLNIKHTIDTGTATPIRQRPYRHSPEARKEIDRQVDKMLESGIIEESTSPWASPVVLVKKKSGGHRLRRHARTQCPYPPPLCNSALGAGECPRAPLQQGDDGQSQ